jgi:4-diphosphocytidyl-2-C-methyl-D-erythritol kinase
MNGRFFAPAKINLSLRVYAPDATGYHPIDTLFCALELADEIVFEPATSGIRLEVSGAELGPAHVNLAYRAAQEFFRATGLPARLAMRLTKRIPAGGGLGGGSSDAASVLLALNRQHHDVLTQNDLLALAARLGSDVAFFLCGSSLAHATGRGEVLRMLPALPRAGVILLLPAFGVATADAYRWLDEERAYAPEDSGLIATDDWDTVARHAHNAFEAVVFRKHPLLGELKSALRESGAQIALLSGSGSALFGVYASVQDRDAAAEHLRQTVADAVVVTTATRA